MRGYDEWLERPYTELENADDDPDMCEWCDRDPYLCYCE